MPVPSRTIRLELDHSDGLLRGRVAEADGADQEFEGWLGLLTVLGTVLDGPVPPPSTPDPQERSR